MARFCPLFSSSKGNSMYLSGAGTSLLIDAGVSCRRLFGAMAAMDLDIHSLDGILITHEHSDHVKGLEVLLRRIDVPVYGSPETLEYLGRTGKVPACATLVAVDAPFQVGDLEIVPFDTPHDAVHSLGFRIQMPDQRVIGVATDLGHISGTVREHLMGCDLVLLESNYDPGMLDCGPYPYILKRRIRGAMGHLSNNDCSEQVAELVRNGSTYFVLGHLSEQNNMPALAYQVSRELLDRANLRERQDYMLHVAPAHGPREVLRF